VLLLLARTSLRSSSLSLSNVLGASLGVGLQDDESVQDVYAMLRS
jgi:hypothetical protein